MVTHGEGGGAKGAILPPSFPPSEALLLPEPPRAHAWIARLAGYPWQGRWGSVRVGKRGGGTLQKKTRSQKRAAPVELAFDSIDTQLSALGARLCPCFRGHSSVLPVSSCHHPSEASVFASSRLSANSFQSPCPVVRSDQGPERLHSKS